MKIEINIPDEAIERIEAHLKRKQQTIASKQGRQIGFKSEGVEYIRDLLQDVVDGAFLETDPEYIEAIKKVRKDKDDADKKAKAKLDALKK